jgi:hypothetical protein
MRRRDSAATVPAAAADDHLRRDHPWRAAAIGSSAAVSLADGKFKFGTSTNSFPESRANILSRNRAG